MEKCTKSDKRFDSVTDFRNYGDVSNTPVGLAPPILSILFILPFRLVLSKLGNSPFIEFVEMLRPRAGLTPLKSLSSLA